MKNKTISTLILSFCACAVIASMGVGLYNVVEREKSETEYRHVNNIVWVHLEFRGSDWDVREYMEREAATDIVNRYRSYTADPRKPYENVAVKVLGSDHSIQKYIRVNVSDIKSIEIRQYE